MPRTPALHIQEKANKSVCAAKGGQRGKRAIPPDGFTAFSLGQRCRERRGINGIPCPIGHPPFQGGLSCAHISVGESNERFRRTVSRRFPQDSVAGSVRVSMVSPCPIGHPPFQGGLLGEHISVGESNERFRRTVSQCFPQDSVAGSVRVSMVSPCPIGHPPFQGGLSGERCSPLRCCTEHRKSCTENPVQLLVLQYMLKIMPAGSARSASGHKRQCSVPRSPGSGTASRSCWKADRGKP